MASDKVLKLDDSSSGYNFDMVKFYTNVGNCNNGDLDPNFFFSGGECDPLGNLFPAPTNRLRASTDLPNCFFPIHFVRANTSVCDDSRQSVPQVRIDR
jgi:hypothetical protein